MKSTIKGILTIIFSVILVMVFTAQSFAWESGGTTNPVTNPSTHEFVAQKGVQILENDLGTAVTSDPNFQILNQHMDQLKKGAIDPDNLKNVAFGGLSENDWWSSHFYDPDSGRSYSSSAPYINAEFQARRFVHMAITDFKNGNFDSAVYKLGYASHFLADLCEPNHAANNTVLNAPYNHSDIESYAQANQNRYAINSAAVPGTTINATYTAVDNYSTIDSFITAKANKYGKISKNYFYSNCNPGSTTTWDTAISATLGNTQRFMAIFYYRFLQELKNSKKLSVRVKTSNVLLSGTDDDIYFGMQTDDGRKIEYLLDKTADILGGIYSVNTYNDFEQNSDDTYTFYINDKDFNFNRVNKCWLRKKTGANANDWRCDSVEVKLDNQFVTSRYLNKWLSGDVTESWNVNGLIPGNSIGVFYVTIKTGDVSWAGTDDNIYFGMALDNGQTVEYNLDKSGYNDFERNCTDTYTLSLNDPMFSASNINRIWMRKSKVLNDDWKFYSISINMNGKSVYNNTPNVWLQGNTIYNIDVNGFSY